MKKSLVVTTLSLFALLISGCNTTSSSKKKKSSSSKTSDTTQVTTDPTHTTSGGSSSSGGTTSSGSSSTSGSSSSSSSSGSTSTSVGPIGFPTYPNGDAETYYDSISSSTLGGYSLLVALRMLNLEKRQTVIGYKPTGTDPSGFFRYTDYDPDTVQYDINGQPYGTKISSFYTYKSTTSWNREHVWPNSHGGGSGGNAGSPYPDQDIHMPRPTISSENSNRSNSFYAEGIATSSNGWDPVTAGYNEYSRGEAARIVFYCTLVNEKLMLAPFDKYSELSGTDPITGVAYQYGRTMGNLETLLKWNRDYAVTQREKNRNEGAEYLQGNRNAFVDHPEYACKIWGTVNSNTRSICGM